MWVLKQYKCPLGGRWTRCHQLWPPIIHQNKQCGDSVRSLAIGKAGNTFSVKLALISSCFNLASWNFV